jgi:hypothetical protein
MSTASSNGKTTQSVSTAGRGSAGKSFDKPGAKPAAKPRMTAEQQKHYLVMGIAAAVVLGVGAIMFFYFYKPATGGEPRLNQPVEKVVQFISTSDFDKLDFDRKKIWMKELSGKKKELLELEKAGKMTRKELEDVLAVAWLGKQFKRVQKYNSMGDLDRKDYLDDILNDKDADGKKLPDEPDENKDRVKQLEETFPAFERNEITSFRKALKDREKDRKKERKKIKKEMAAAAHSPTTRPTTRVGEKPPGTAPAAHPSGK